MIDLKIVNSALDIGSAMNSVNSPQCGAISIFIGTTREQFNGNKVKTLFYEAYESMALNEMKSITVLTRQKWPEVVNIAIHHRIGEVKVGEAGVVIAASSPHRKHAQEAVSFILERLKTTVPIFKKEQYEDGSGIWKANEEGMPPRNLNMHPPRAHQMSSFHPPGQNSEPPPVMQGFPGPQVINHTSQPRAHMSSPAGNLCSPYGPPRHPAFHGAWPVLPPTSAPQMGMRNFNPGLQVMNAAGAFPFRPGNTQPQQNYPTRPQGVFSPNQQFSGNLPFPPNRPSLNSFGRHQNYDPFSPTSGPPRPQSSVNQSQRRNQENDPEYEDLMASVGVK